MANAQVSVPFTFPVTFDTDNDEEVLAIWKDYLTNILTQAFANESGIQVEPVQLSGVKNRLLRRFLAVESLIINGSADFIIDEDKIDWKEFSNQVQSILAEATTMENLQQALTNAGSPTVLTAPTMAPVKNDDSEQLNRRAPTNAEIVLGFAILILTLLSLLYWANLLWKKREKRKRREQLEALRQQSLRNAVMGAPPVPKLPVHLQSLTSQEEDDEFRLMSMAGSPVASPAAAVTDGESSQSSDLPSDPFALELQKAVSHDRRAWEEYHRNISHHAEGVEVATSVNTSSVTSFPYGDEDERGASPTVRISSPYSLLPPIREETRNRSVERVKARLHETPENKASNKEYYSPYGEPHTAGGTNRAVSSLMEDSEKQAQYSFLHPLRPRDVEADIPNVQGSSHSDDTPTSGAVRESIDVTSVEDSKTFESKENDPAEPADQDTDWPTSLTETMLREVEYISQFVRRYEQKHSKTSNKKSKPGELYDDSGEVIDALALERDVATPTNRSALQPVSNSSALEEGRMQTNQLPRVEPIRPSRVEEETYRGRLGIGKFTIGRPVTNRSTNFDNKPSRAVQFRDTMAEVSPIHSEEELSPRKIQMTNATESNKNPGRLSSLRSNESILDITPIGEFTVDDSGSPRQVSNDSTPPASSALSARRQRRQEVLKLAAEAAEPDNRRKKKVSPRSSNMTFNNIRSIFETKETNPIVPPNEHVSILRCF